MTQNPQIKKRIRQSLAFKAKNRHYKTKIKNLIKNIKISTTEEKHPLFRKLQQIVDKGAKKDILHQNKAARIKSKIYTAYLKS